MAPLVACPHCNVHAILTEKVCPHCGNTLRRADGSIPKTAAAVVLGLTVAAAGAMGCADDGDPVPEYGVAATGSSSSAMSGGGGMGGAGGADPTPEYGVAGAGAGGEAGAGGAPAGPEYGVAGSSG